MRNRKLISLTFIFTILISFIPNGLVVSMAAEGEKEQNACLDQEGAGSSFNESCGTLVNGISNSNTTPAVKNNGEEAIIDSQIIINNITEIIDGASVVINNYKSEDILAFDDTDKIKGEFNSENGVLTLRGEATANEYQAALRSVRFSTQSQDNSDRTITFNLGTALYYNGHYYQYIDSPKIKWTDARVSAEQRNFFGRQGYLATITSQEENNFIKEKTNGIGWIGASDNYEQINRVNNGISFTNQSETEGQWYWVTGPEAGTKFWNNQTGLTENGMYENWYITPSGRREEPNNSNGEDYAHILGPGGAFWNNDPNGYGQWNDFPNDLPEQVQGYIVEYGGMTGDSLDISNSTSINLKIIKESSNSSLLSLSINEEQLKGFSPENLNYTEMVESDVSNIVVTPIVDDDKATMTVNGNPYTTGEKGVNIHLNKGENIITIVVTAEDGTTKTYSIFITRELTSLDRMNVAKKQDNITDILLALTDPALKLDLPEGFAEWDSDSKEMVVQKIKDLYKDDYENINQLQYIVDLASFPLNAFDDIELSSVKDKITAYFNLFLKGKDVFPTNDEFEKLAQMGRAYSSMSEVDKEIFAYKI